MINGVDDLYAYLEELGEPVHPEWAGGNDSTVETEFAAFIRSGKTAEDFYRESKTYPYHLAWFGEDQWKEPYRRIILENFVPPTTMLEFGCGIGSDGLKFIEKGFKVDFMDYPSTCTTFLEWRLDHHNIDANVFDFSEPIAPHGLVFAFDVVEHVEDPYTLLTLIEGLGKYVAVNFLAHVGEPSDGKEHLHYHHDPQTLVDWVKQHAEIVQDREFHYARFLIYRPIEQAPAPSAPEQKVSTLDNSSRED